MFRNTTSTTTNSATSSSIGTAPEREKEQPSTSDRGSPPGLHATEGSSTLSAAPDRSGLKWKPKGSKVALKSGADSENKANAPVRSVAQAILDGNYDGALRALARGKSPTAQMGRDGLHAKAHALTLLAWHAVPVKFLRAFLDQVAEVYPDSLDEPDGSGRTALTSAVQCGDSELIALLLEAGADPAHVDANGKSAFDIALANADEGVMAQLRSHSEKTALDKDKEDLVAECIRTGEAKVLGKLAGKSSGHRRAVMRRIVSALSAMGEELDSSDKGGRTGGMRREFVNILALLDGPHQYLLLLKLIKRRDGSAGRMTPHIVGALSLQQLRRIRQVAGEDAAVHEWAYSRDTSLQEPDADVDLEEELLLAQDAGNIRRYAELRAKTSASSLAPLADAGEKQLLEHLRSSGAKIANADIEQATTREGFMRLLKHCDLNEVIAKSEEGALLIVNKAVAFNCPQAVKQMFSLDRSLAKPWAGLHGFDGLRESMMTPLKTAIRKGSEEMVRLLFELGTVPMDKEVAEAEACGGTIASIVSAAYFAIPEEERV
jgi:hypothetical protein